MHFLGKICRLQVQPTSLKVGDRSRRSYDPAGIRAVPKLSITKDGVTGWSDWASESMTSTIAIIQRQKTGRQSHLDRLPLPLRRDAPGIRRSSC